MFELSRKPAIFVAIATAACTSVAILPTFLLGSGGAIGDRTVDALGTWWFQWWIADTLTEGNSLLTTDRLFYPWGKDLLLHTGANILDPIAILPVRALFGQTVAWNALYIGILITNALAAGAWAVHLTRSRPAVVTAVALAVFHPFVLHELQQGRPTQALLWPLIGCLAFGYEAFHGERGHHRRWAVAAGVTLAIAGWVYWYAACFGAMALTTLALTNWRRRSLECLALAGLTSFLLTAPGVLPLASALHSGDIPGLLPTQAWMGGEFALSGGDGDWIRLSTFHLSGGVGFETIDGWDSRGLGLGIASGLVILGVGRHHWQWLAVATLSLVVAVGPFVAGHANPIYHLFLDFVPGMERLYWPARALVLTLPCGIAGAAYWIARRKGRAASLWAGILCAALVIEACIRGPLPFNQWDPKVPEGYACLTEADGAMIVLPYGRDHEPLLHQTVHRRPLLGGMNARSASLVPDEQREFREGNGWMNALLIAARNPSDNTDWTPEDKAAVEALGYRWVLARKDVLGKAASGPGQARWMRYIRSRLNTLAGPAIYEDDDFILYAPWGGTVTCDKA